ncbi:MAG: DedA family protein [Planctomycetota bacterium]|nr:DedA family protein [Planctomycetota bacterium]
MNTLLATLLPLAGLADDLMAWLEASDGLAGYGIMLIAFLVGSVGFPLPEEAVLAMGGYLAATGALSLVGVYLFGYSVVLIMDLLLYEIGRRAGPAVEQSRMGRKIAPERWTAARGFFERRGILTVVIARFVMGTRITIFLLAGALQMERRRYYVAVAISGLFSNAIPVILGYLLADRISELLGGIGQAYDWAGGITVALVGALIAAFVLLRWRRRRRTQPAGASDGGSEA